MAANIYTLNLDSDIQKLENEYFTLYEKYYGLILEYEKLKDNISFNLLAEKLNMVEMELEDLIVIHFDLNILKNKKKNDP